MTLDTVLMGLEELKQYSNAEARNKIDAIKVGVRAMMAQRVVISPKIALLADAAVMDDVSPNEG